MPIKYGRRASLRTTFAAVSSAILLLLSATSSAQLPSLGKSLSLTGTPSSAQYFGASQANGRSSVESSFRSGDTLTLKAEIHVDPSHAGSLGNLYVVASLGTEFFMGDELGNFLPWDLDIGSLRATARNKRLDAIERLDILENVSVGRLAIEGRQPEFYFGYNLSADTAELYYHDQPLSFAVERYDPLSVSIRPTQVVQSIATDQSRDRSIPVKVYLPYATSPRPVVLFSHGLGGNLQAATYLGMHWAARGYTVVFMQHPGSDEDIFAGVPVSALLTTLNAAASLNNLDARIRDVAAVIDQLEAWNSDAEHTLFGRLDLDLIAMTGHSFGARTTQAVSGENLRSIIRSTREPRIKVAIPFSPSSNEAESFDELFKDVDIPWLLMTGTEDVAVVGDTSVADRLAVFPALPPVGKYELVLFEGEHHAFTDRELSTVQKPRNPQHHDIIKALSTAFLDAWLNSFPDALNWLEGEGAREVLLPMDSWQFK
jgi:dienelactone hydrolase